MFSNQWFEGKAHPGANTAHILGVLNVKSYQPSDRSPNPGPIQDDHAEESLGKIQAKAKEIAAGVGTSYDAAKAVVHWVTQEIAYNPRDGFLSMNASQTNPAMHCRDPGLRSS